jgi:hypothetical protein
VAVFDLLAGLVCNAVLVGSAAAMFLGLRTAFARVDLPVWLEGGITAMLCLFGGLLCMSLFIQTVSFAPDLRRVLRETRPMPEMFAVTLGACLASVLTWWALSLLRVDEMVTQAGVATCGAGAWLGGLMLFVRLMERAGRHRSSSGQ